MLDGRDIFEILSVHDVKGHRDLGDEMSMTQESSGNTGT